MGGKCEGPGPQYHLSLKAHLAYAIDESGELFASQEIITLSFRDAGCNVILLPENSELCIKRTDPFRYTVSDVRINCSGESISVCFHSHSNHHHHHLLSTPQTCHCLVSHQHVYGAQLKAGC